MHLQIGIEVFYIQAASLLRGEIHVSGDGILLPADVGKSGVNGRESIVQAIEERVWIPLGLHIIHEDAIGQFDIMDEDVPVICIPLKAIRYRGRGAFFLFGSGRAVAGIIVDRKIRIL